MSTIAEYPVASPLDGTEAVPAFQNGSQVQVSAAQLADLKTAGVIAAAVAAVRPELDATAAAAESATAAVVDPRSQTLADQSLNRVLIVKGGKYENKGANQRGAIKAHLPGGIDARKTTTRVQVDDQYGSLIFTIVGTNNVGQWNYTKARVEGDHDVLVRHPVRFGNDGAGDCFWIGDVDYVYWTDLAVTILDVTYTGNVITEAWLGAWSVTLVTAFDGADRVTAGPIIPRAPMPTIDPVFSGTLNGVAVKSAPNRGDLLIGSRGIGDTFVGNSTYNHLMTIGGGLKFTTAFNNVGSGLEVFADGETIEACTAIGTQSQQHNKRGRQYCSFGIHAHLSVIEGIGGIAIGPGCLEYGTDLTNTIGIGPYTGRDYQGKNSLLIGNRVGLYGNFGDNQLRIGNNENESLIEGDFAVRTLKVNGAMMTEGLVPSSDNSFALGSGTLRFSSIYVASGQISTSDERQKRDIEAIPDDWLDAWAEVEWSRYRFVGGNRWHTGLVAQRVHAAFERHGIDAFEIGLCCHDEWDEQRAPIMEEHDVEKEYTKPVADPDGDQVVIDLVPKQQEDGTVVFVPTTQRFRQEVETKTVTQLRDTGKTELVRAAGHLWGLRYDECFAIEAAYQRQQIALQRQRADALEAQLAELQKRLAA